MRLRFQCFQCFIHSISSFIAIYTLHWIVNAWAQEYGLTFIIVMSDSSFSINYSESGLRRTVLFDDICGWKEHLSKDIWASKSGWPFPCLSIEIRLRTLNAPQSTLNEYKACIEIGDMWWSAPKKYKCEKCDMN